MTNFFESQAFISPSQVREDVADRLKDARNIKSLELLVKGESLEDAKSFGQLLWSLKRQGVKITHEFSIKLDFPHSISKDAALQLVGRMPKAKNGALKVRIQFHDASQSPIGTE